MRLKFTRSGVLRRQSTKFTLGEGDKTMRSTVDNSTKLSRFSSPNAASYRRFAVILAVTFSFVVCFALGQGTASIAFAANTPMIRSFSSTPTSITAGQSATLSWTAQNAQSFSIDNGVGVVSGTSVTVHPTVTTTYTLTASNSQGSATAQTTVTVTQGQDTSAPTVPTGLAASAVSTSQINLSWSPSTDNVGVVGYYIYRNGSFVGTAGSTNYSDTGLSASITYTYKVAAYDAAGNASAQSSPASATTSSSAADTQAPTVPAGLAASAVSASQINLTWNASTDNVGVVGYYIYRNSSFVGTAGSTSYSDTGLSASTTYTYKVAAYDAAGNASAQSSPASATTSAGADTQAPTVPAALAASAVSASQINLTWSASTDNVGVVGYYIYRNGSFVRTAGTTSYSDTGLSTGITYTYRVAAYDAAGNASAQSSSASATTSAGADTQAPTVPSGLAASAVSASQINLTWNASTDNVGVVGYRIYRNGSLAATASGTSYSDTGLSASTTYTYNVAAYDAAGNTSAQSSPVSATTSTAADTQAPTVPAGLAASAVSASQINLTWNASTDNVGVVGYRVYRNGSLAASVGGTSYSDTGLSASTTYTYKVAAYDAAGNASAQSSPATATTSSSGADTQAPTVPAALAASAVSASQINLTWSASSDNVGVVGYYIYRNGSFVRTAGTTSYSDTGLSTGITYTYRVAAYDAAGNASAQSSPASATTLGGADTQAPTVPSGLAASAVSASQINLTWNASTDNVGVVGYRIYRNGSLAATASGTSYSDTGLSASTTYTYNVAAYDAAGNASAQSSSASATTLGGADTQAPTVPAGLAATAVSASQINLTWSASTDNVGVVGYRVYRNGSLAASVGGTSYSDTGLSASTTYTYKVAAYDAAGNASAQSSPAIATTSSSGADTQAPTVPAALAASAVSASQINLTWSASTDNVGVTGYYIYRNGSFVATAGGTSYSDAGLSATTTYTYKVAAYDAAGNTSAQSSPASATTSAAADTQPPTVSIASPTGGMVSGSVAITANAADNVSIASVQVYVDGAAMGSPITTAPYSRMWNTTIATNSSHVLSAMAKDSAGNSTMSSGVSVTVNNTTSNRPYGTSFPLTENPISENNNWINGLSTGLDWGNVQTTSGLAFGTNVSGAPPYNDSTAVLAGTWGPNQTVTGTVHSVNQTSSFYEEVELRLRTTITPHSITGYEINFRCTSDGSQYIGIVRWNGPLNNFSYITILDPGGPGIHNGDVVSASIVGSTITGYINGVAVITGTDGTYTNGSPGIGFWNQNGTVAADSNYGFVSFSASDGSTSDSTPPSTPTNLSAAGVSPSQVNLTWTPSTDNVLVTGYKIFRNNIQVGTSPTNSFSDTGLSSNTSYSYSVAAFDAAGNVSGQSLTATASTGGADTIPPSVPSGLASSNVSQTSLTLSWTASSDNVGVAGYQIFRNGTQVGTTASTSYTDTGLAASTTYDYSVAAYDSSNNHSSQSGQIIVTTLAPAGHAPTFVQMTQAQISNGSSVSVPFNSATTSGNTIVAYVIWSNVASATVTDSQGNTFKSVTAPVSWGGSNSTQIFYATNVAGGADTVTATFRNAVSSFGVIYIHEYAGINATNPVDVSVSATGSSAAMNSGSATTTSPNDLIFGAGVSDMAVTAAGPGFAARSMAFGNVTEDESATSAGSYAGTATHDGAVWEMQMVAFRAAN